MESKPNLPKGHDSAFLSLNAAINALVLARDTAGANPVRDAFISASSLLATIRDSAANEADCVQLGLTCADICNTLHQREGGGQTVQFNQSILPAAERLTATMTNVQKYIVKRGKRNTISRFFHAKNDREMMAAWRLDLNNLCHVFNTKLDIGASNTSVAEVLHQDLNVHTATSGAHDPAHPRPSDLGDSHLNALKTLEGANRAPYASAPSDSLPILPTPGTILDMRRDVVKTQTIISDVQRDVVGIHRILKNREDNKGQYRATWNRSATLASIVPSIPGESPPPPPRACFGREELIETIINLAENFHPIALIGAGGIGKTSVALAVLHHDRIKERFGDNRRFVRCDQFPASQANLLSRLSKVIGACVENPNDLIPLRPSLSSKETFIVLDNAEHILDPQGADGQEIYGVVKELSQFSNICLVITSRITTIPPGCTRLDVPTLSIGAARSAFHHIYNNNERPDLIGDILKQLDFHPLSVTLLATVAHQNMWDNNRLAKEWEQRQMGLLQTEHNESLAATIKLSLTSPMFKNLGPLAQELLGVIAFFPQGIDEKNLDWLFPTISNRAGIFDKLCALSLTHRSNGFITTLMPLRDHLCPKDPLLSPLLCKVKEYYFTRISVELDPEMPDFKDTLWIISEDANVEHLLNVFLSIDMNLKGIWSACASFMSHLYWHKPRQTVLRAKVEGLPEDHRSKPKCLFQLSRLSESVGNYLEQKQFLNHILRLERERKNDYRIAKALSHLSGANQMLGLHKEGIKQAEEALEIFKHLDRTVWQARCLIDLAGLLWGNGQYNAAEEVATSAIDLLSNKGQEFLVCGSHRILGGVYHSRGEGEKAIYHFKLAFEIASPFNWHGQLFWIHHSLAEFFLDEDRFDDAHMHIEQARSHVINDVYCLGRVVLLQARVWYQLEMFEEATSEVLYALKIFEKLGAAECLEACQDLLENIEQKDQF